jgi:hypothetical protein
VTFVVRQVDALIRSITIQDFLNALEQSYQSVEIYVAVWSSFYQPTRMKIAPNGAPFHDFPQFNDSRTQAALQRSQQFRLLSQLQLSRQELLDEENKTRAKLHQELQSISSDIASSINLIEQKSFGLFLPEKLAKNVQSNLEHTLYMDSYELHISAIEYRQFTSGRTPPTIKLRDIVAGDSYEVSFKRSLKSPQSLGLHIRFNQRSLMKAHESPHTLLESADRENRFAQLIGLRDLLQEFVGA